MLGPRPVRQGRPSKSISTAFLKNAFNPSRNISITKIASVLGVHRNTLSRKLRETGIQRRYSEISDQELQAIIREFRIERPDAGQSYVIAHFRQNNIRVQRWRLRKALQEVDGVGIRLRTRKPIIRRSYSNPRPMAVWHMDAHLKANHWGISLHGIIDGYSRKVRRLYSHRERTERSSDSEPRCAVQERWVCRLRSLLQGDF